MAPTTQQIDQACEYMLSLYDDSVHMCAESDDQGTHWLLQAEEEFHDLPLTYQNVFWVYSDNLFAYRALEPWRPTYSQVIKAEVERLIGIVGQPGMFEVVVGRDIPRYDRIGDATNHLYSSTNEKFVAYRRHDKLVYLIPERYADTCCYVALDYFFAGKRDKALEWFFKAAMMWNGKGMYDYASQLDGFYANYKMGLLLFTKKVLGAELSTADAIETKLWTMQNPATGGMTSLADSDGIQIGSGNIETTSLTLITYNQTFITELQSSRYYCTVDEVKKMLSLTGSDWDELILKLIKVVTKGIDAKWGQSFLVNDVESAKYYNTSGGKVQLIDTLRSLTSVKIDTGMDGGFATTLVENTDFTLGPENSTPKKWVQLLPNGQLEKFSTQTRSLEVTGVWGYESIPEQVQVVCAKNAARLFKRKDTAYARALASPEFGGFSVYDGFDNDDRLLMKGLGRRKAILYP
ncbi:MAG: hypothetical protein PHV74_00120 [Dehalococcoidia bacterium]|nr:hypothetical protein [Dehalococcoidia bacterium]